MTTGGGFHARPSWDGRSVYFVKLDVPEVWRMPVAGGPAELVLSGLDLSDWGSWVAGEHGIYHITRSPTTRSWPSSRRGFRGPRPAFSGSRSAGSTGDGFGPQLAHTKAVVAVYWGATPATDKRRS